MSGFTLHGTKLALENSLRTQHLAIPRFRIGQRRVASTRSAINQGIRKEQLKVRYTQLGGLFRAQRSDKVDERDNRRERSHYGVPARGARKEEDMGFAGKDARPTRTSPVSIKDTSWDQQANKTQMASYEPSRTSSNMPMVDTETRTHRRGGVRRSDNERGSQRRAHFQSEGTQYPISIPYTTAASEFLYGHGEVYASLRANRRKFYKLYIHQRGSARDEAAKELKSIRLLAAKVGVPIVTGSNVDIRLLDKMSNGRPHNGFVLEASRLPIPPIRSLGNVLNNTTSFALHLDPQSREDLAINGTPSNIKFDSHQPVVLLLDDILDSGNVGAILRSAYFLGIDAVLLTGHCAPFNPATLKASAGAAEAIPLFRVARPDLFLQQSEKAGWHSIAAATPREHNPNADLIFTSQIRYKIPNVSHISQIGAWASSSPKIIVIGGEGRGLRNFITDNVQSFIEFLPQRSPKSMGIDSLNVSVAASLACQEIMSRLRAGANAEPHEGRISEAKKSESSEQDPNTEQENSSSLDTASSESEEGPEEGAQHGSERI